MNRIFRTIVLTFGVATLVMWLQLALVQAAIIPRLEQGEKLIITAIGTSLTDSGSATWFTRMAAWLEKKYPGQVISYDEAIGGSASKYTDTYKLHGSGLDVQLGMALERNPDVIFIEFAVNDAYLPYSITPQMSKDNLQAMIDRINTWAAAHKKAAHKKTVDIVIQTMNNVIGVHAVARPHLANYYQGYRDVAAANKLLLIDHYANWVGLYSSKANRAIWSSYVPDGCHPNNLGAEKVIVPEIQREMTAQGSKPQH